MMSWQECFCRYAMDPHGFWDTARQADKLVEARTRLSRWRGCDARQAVEDVVSLAQRRIGSCRPPVYIVGLGGSGTHWLAALLAELPGFATTREVYFPEKLVRDIDCLHPHERARVVDCVHLLHATAWRRRRPTNESMVNNARGDPERYREWTPDSTIVYLHRDPRDQVMSVTFRKQEYRAYVAPDADNEEYLQRNVRQNIHVFRRYKRLSRLIDHSIRYETLVADPQHELEGLLAACRADHAPESVEHAVSCCPPRRTVQVQPPTADEAAMRRRLNSLLAEPILGLGYALDQEPPADLARGAPARCGAS
ncbi:MAG: sulfotransferase [Polyangiaceae bacterium]|nr:sulfotransferase [Polyangiaceae bacterium]